jgi:hypothetical protein
VFQGLDGIKNIFDDVFVHGTTKEEHDNRLEEILKRLQAKELTPKSGMKRATKFTKPRKLLTSDADSGFLA